MAILKIRTTGEFPGAPALYEVITYTLSGNLTATNNGTDTVDIFKTS